MTRLTRAHVVALKMVMNNCHRVKCKDKKALMFDIFEVVKSKYENDIEIAYEKNTNWKEEFIKEANEKY